jgi:GTP-binding protein HflX
MQDSPLQRALLLAVELPETREEFRPGLAELGRLVKTLGYEVVGQVTQSRTSLAAAAVVGEGKLKELVELTTGAPPVEDEKKEQARDKEKEETEPLVELVAVDHELTPSQLRNLERATGTSVLDRTGVIIEIFHRHAKSREARLQVELARLRYAAPRLRESPRGKQRQQGRGAGESQLELDRRKIRDRIAELREQLEAVQREQAVRRSQRSSERRVALVGYTNAGKSSLMRGLTGSDVYVENKLFATLDTTVRALTPAVGPRILVSDTVGFIRKLPHDLVASFKSTLDEALNASLLLHVVDASDPAWESQLEVTRAVLAEIGASAVPSRVVMNKLDLVAKEEREPLQAAFPDAWFISAHAPEDLALVRDAIRQFFEASYVEAELLVPYAAQRLVSELHELGRVLEERYEEQGVAVRVRALPEDIRRVQSRLSET